MIPDENALYYELIWGLYVISAKRYKIRLALDFL